MSYYALLDCNNFFVSCERLFRPDLVKRPVAVLSSNDGCVVARSQEVKDMGIPMGIPYFQVREVCEKEGVTLFSSNFTLYRDISARVMRTLKDEVGACEVYSVDEAFFELCDDVSENDITKIRERVLRDVGVPVSIGVGRTKTIAKEASHVAKENNGVCILTDEKWKEYAPQVACGRIWGVGRRTAEKFRAHDVHTAADVTALDRSFLESEFGVMGVRLWFELSGIPSSSRHAGEDERGSITSTRSFAKKTYSLAPLESAVSYHVSYVAAKLRTEGLVTSRIIVMARAGRHSDFALRTGSIEVELSRPTADTATLLREALTALRNIYDPEVPYKKAGCIASGLMPAEHVSGTLFSDEKDGDVLLDAKIDALNERFGRGILVRAVETLHNGWRSSTKLSSPPYTTNWNTLATVKAK
jgi:DNA polymerase V